MNTRRAVYIFLSVLALFLVGTVVVLSSVTYYLAIDPKAYITEAEVQSALANTSRQNERIPRIIHQTWKTDVLPPRWQPISQACRDMMPDYEYKLWSDESARQFIAEHYPWFLDTYDNYPYTIQRADVIRYFVLHHFGGVYVDLDIGCQRPMDPLLQFSVILPKTIPVGISNDLIFGEKGHPFFLQTINNLVTFDHSWVLNYPTVMFSTGPMFLSAQFGIYTSSHPTSALKEVRVLPKSLYGKNALPEEAPNSFFSHFYGSSWHADDAAFIGFLGTWGKVLMWVGLMVLVIGIFRIPKKSQRRGYRRLGLYDLRLPRSAGRWYLPLVGLFSSPPSPASSPSSSQGRSSLADNDVPVLHLPLNLGPPSPLSDSDNEPFAGRNTPIRDAFRRVRNRVTSIASPREEVPMTPLRPRRQRDGMLFFLPAIFAPSARSTDHIEEGDDDLASPPPAYSTPSSHLLPNDRKEQPHDLESGPSDYDEQHEQQQPFLQRNPRNGSHSIPSSSVSFRPQ
ncbi:MIPC synthase [Coprinopsis sp. MPI-PUGE-AT-0042]|nr:MIPC synthase [Coprinopsis sp. MPI-PUGE-AT-0042]